MKYLTCIDFNEATNTCTTQVWADQVVMQLDPVFFPNLSVEQVYSLLGAIALVFAIAWGWKFIVNAIENKR